MLCVFKHPSGEPSCGLPVVGMDRDRRWGCLGSCSNNENMHLGLCGLRGNDSLSRRRKAIPAWRESPDSPSPPQQAPGSGQWLHRKPCLDFQQRHILNILQRRGRWEARRTQCNLFLAQFCPALPGSHAGPTIKCPCWAHPGISFLPLPSNHPRFLVPSHSVPKLCCLYWNTTNCEQSQVRACHTHHSWLPPCTALLLPKQNISQRLHTYMTSAFSTPIYRTPWKFSFKEGQKAAAAFSQLSLLSLLTAVHEACAWRSSRVRAQLLSPHSLVLVTFFHIND